MPLIDFKARLLETGDPLQYHPFRLHGHFTAEGYALLAEQILQEVPGLHGDGEVSNGAGASLAPERLAPSDGGLGIGRSTF